MANVIRSLFSWLIIALFNHVAMLLLLALLVHHFGLAGHLFWERLEDAYTWTAREIARGFAWGQAEWQRKRS